MKTIIGSLIPLLATFSPAWSADSQLPSTVKVTIRMHGDDTRELQHEFIRGDERVRWNIETKSDAPFMDLQQVRLTSEHDGENLRFNYQFKGPEDPIRRILIDMRAVDKSGDEVLHTWTLDSDARIGPHEIPMGSTTWMRSNRNHSRLEIPADVVPCVASYEVEIRELSAEEVSTFPLRKHKMRLAKSRTNHSGQIEFVFDNPEGWEINACEHKIAFTQFIYNADGSYRERRTRFLKCQASGNYRVVSKIRPDYIAHSHVSIAMYTDQNDGGKFERRFFIERKGTSYSGIWTGDGGKIVQLPFVDSDYR